MLKSILYHAIKMLMKNISSRFSVKLTVQVKCLMLLVTCFQGYVWLAMFKMLLLKSQKQYKWVYTGWIEQSLLFLV